METNKHTAPKAKNENAAWAEQHMFWENVMGTKQHNINLDAILELSM